MQKAQQSLGVSERRACRVLGQARSTQQYRAKVPEGEAAVVERMAELATQYGRYGYRRITALLEREGWCVNHKRIERLWRREGLKVPQKQPKRGRLWLNDGSCVRLRPARRDHVWAYDFVHERTHDGKALRLLTIVDEYTRECLAIDVARKLNSENVLERLAELFVNRGVPEHIRSDNGPEFTAQAVREWLGRIGVKTLFIEPGSPWENGYVESFNGKLRDEFLDREMASSLQPRATAPLAGLSAAGARSDVVAAGCASLPRLQQPLVSLDLMSYQVAQTPGAGQSRYKPGSLLLPQSHNFRLD